MTKGEELLKKIISGKPKGEEWFDLQKEVLMFLNEDNPEEEKIRIKGYTEMIAMACEAVNNIKKRTTQS